MSARPSQRLAVIDLGSNTARLVVMQHVPGYAYRLEDEIREVVRLRQGMGESGLSPEAMERAFSTLRLFKRFCDSSGVEQILPTATSAVREAANGRAFIERVESEIGLSLCILEGEKEAYYGVIGALNEVPMRQGFVLDIGGGSAQLSEVAESRFRRGQALTLGALALSERFVRSDPASEREVEAIDQEIARQLDTLSWLGKARKGTRLVGLGGTIRNLAGMDVARHQYPLNTLLGYVLDRGALEENIAALLSLPLEKRRKIPGLHADRADIILPGALVLRQVMERLGARELTISTSGLREGVFLERFWAHLPYPVIPDVRRFSVLNIARNYRYQKHHANHVRFLAGRLFEELAPLHGYGRAEREWLEAAALLHDLGTVIAYDGHHKHSQTLIDYNGLPGFAPRELALIGLLARYHRKGHPEIAGFEALLGARDEQCLRCLAAILRLAEFLERGRNSAVDDVIVTWTDAELRLTLVADEYPAVEMWETERHALELVEAAFGRRPLLDSTAAPPEERPA